MKSESYDAAKPGIRTGTHEAEDDGSLPVDNNASNIVQNLLDKALGKEN